MTNNYITINQCGYDFRGFDSEEQQNEALIAMLQSGEDFSMGDYMICTESGKEKELKNYITDSLWAFNTSFLMSYLSGEEDSYKELYNALANVGYADSVYVDYIPYNEEDSEEWEIDYNSIDIDQLEKALQSYQGDKCENANDLIYNLIGDIDEFISDAESADGAGHFLNHYDGKEIEVSSDTETFYIYRAN